VDDQPTTPQKVLEGRPTTSKPSRWAAAGIGFAGGVLLFTALYYQASRTGLWLIPIGIILLFPLIASVQLALRGFLIWLRCRTSKVVVAQAVLWLLVVGFHFVQGYSWGTPKASFEQWVMRPTPPSIRNFRWNGWVGIGGDRSVAITFQAEPSATREVIEHYGLVPESESKWFIGDTTNETVSCNVNLSNWCTALKFPFEPLTAPVVYRSPEGFKQGHNVELVTDQDFRRVYMRLQ